MIAEVESFVNDRLGLALWSAQMLQNMIDGWTSSKERIDVLSMDEVGEAVVVFGMMLWAVCVGEWANLHF
jgi:hypothetical protein